MDLSRIINMVINLFLRKVVSRGIDAGIDYAAGKAKAPQEMTPSEQEQARIARETAKRAKQAASLTRRL